MTHRRMSASSSKAGATAAPTSSGDSGDKDRAPWAGGDADGQPPGDGSTMTVSAGDGAAASRAPGVAPKGAMGGSSSGDTAFAFPGGRGAPSRRRRSAALRSRSSEPGVSDVSTRPPSASAPRRFRSLWRRRWLRRATGVRAAISPGDASDPRDSGVTTVTGVATDGARSARRARRDGDA